MQPTTQFFKPAQPAKKPKEVEMKEIQRGAKKKRGGEEKEVEVKEEGKSSAREDREKSTLHRVKRPKR